MGIGLRSFLRDAVSKRQELARVTFSSNRAPAELRANLLRFIEEHPYTYHLTDYADSQSDTTFYHTNYRRNGRAFIGCRFTATPDGGAMVVVVWRDVSLLLRVIWLPPLFLLPGAWFFVLVFLVAAWVELVWIPKLGLMAYVAEEAAMAAGMTSARYFDFKGPPCPHCGKALLSAYTKQCLSCHESWHTKEGEGS